MTTAAEAVTQFVGDVGIAHAIIHGPATGPNSIVTTEGGDVRTLARAVAEGGATAAEVAALQTAIESLQTSNLTDWDTATADFLTAENIPNAPVTKVAGRTGEVTLQTSDLTDWSTATAEFGGGATLITPDSPAASPTPWDDHFQEAELDTTGARHAGAQPWDSSGPMICVPGGIWPDPATATERRISLAATEPMSWAAKVWETFGIYAVDADGWILEFSVGMSDAELFPRINWFVRNPAWSVQNSGWVVFPATAAGNWVRHPLYVGLRYTGSACDLLISYSGLAGTYKSIASRPLNGLTRVGLNLQIGSGVMWVRKILN